jgi:hypothetical protein
MLEIPPDVTLNVESSLDCGLLKPMLKPIRSQVSSLSGRLHFILNLIFLGVLIPIAHKILFKLYACFV